MTGFGVLALTLAAVGIYGVFSYFVGERTHEIAVRLALGATPAAVRRLVVGRGLTLTAAGLALGLVGAVAVSGAATGLLYEVSALDPPPTAPRCCASRAWPSPRAGSRRTAPRASIRRPGSDRADRTVGLSADRRDRRRSAGSTACSGTPRHLIDVGFDGARRHAKPLGGDLPAGKGAASVAA